MRLKLVQPLWKSVWRPVLKLSVCLPSDSIESPCAPKGHRGNLHNAKLGTPQISTDRRTQNIMCYIHIMDYYVIKKPLLRDAGIKMNMTAIMLSKKKTPVRHRSPMEFTGKN